MEHVILCNGQDANQEWTNHVTNFGAWLIEVDTHPSIHCCISESLMQCLSLTSFVSHFNQVCHSTALEQDEIRWQNFVEGKISKHWVSCNFSIIMIHIPNDQWIDGHWVWFLIY
jgi:hypothetical protein